MKSYLEWLDTDGFYVKQSWDIASGQWVEGFNGKLQLFDHQRRILGHCFTPREDGTFPYSTVVISAVKKSGKTTLESSIGTWYAQEAPGSEIYFVANDLEQAQQRAFEDLSHHVIHAGLGTPTAKIARFNNGSFIQVLAQHYSSAAGSRPSLVMYDELWGYCLTPETTVLRNDLRWVKGEDLKVGDKVLSFDENRVIKGRNHCRRFKTGTVTGVGFKILPCLKITLENGKTFRCTPEHKWLTRRGIRRTCEWWEAKDLRVGDQLMRVLDTWEEDKSYEAGYLAGAFDGEGSLTQEPRCGWRLDFAQRENPMRDQVKSYLTKFGFRWWDANKVSKDCKNLGMAYKQEVLRFLGTIRPARLLPKVNFDRLGRMTALEYVGIKSIEELRPMEMVTLSIDASTFFADGYATHNTSERSRRMWAEMTLPPTIPNAMRVIVTYAGFEDESDLLMDVYKKSFVNGTPVPELEDIVDDNGNPVCKSNGRTFVYWDTVPRMPWQTSEYYEQEMANIRPSDFLRMHRNQWVTSSETFIPIALWDKAASKLQGPLTLLRDLPTRNLPITIGVDIGAKHDSSAIVGVYYDQTRNKVGLAFHAIWLPVEGETLDIENTVEYELIKLWKEFKIMGVLFDPSQFLRSGVSLRRRGLPMIEFPQTEGNMTTATGAFYDLLTTHNLEAYLADDLRDHVRFSTVRSTPRGYRLTKMENSKKIDAAVALAMACYYAVKVGGIDLSAPVVIVNPFSDMSSMRVPSINIIDQMKLPPALRS